MSASEQPLREALDYLVQQKVIRQRVDADTKQTQYLLEHDYLCSGVLEAERRARRWRTITEDAQRRFERAGGSWGKWDWLIGGFGASSVMSACAHSCC